jgi:hypothetical protein
MTVFKTNRPSNIEMLEQMTSVASPGKYYPHVIGCCIGKWFRSNKHRNFLEMFRYRVPDYDQEDYHSDSAYYRLRREAQEM